MTAVPAEIGGLNAAEFAAIVEGLRALPLELRWGHIAHDLRNPVSLIGASAQLLAMAADKLEPEDRQILSILENAADRLHTLIDAYIEAHKPDTSV
ncbi:MAG: histidine kinase dimerization/phospho-acceptor domain-containing protein [bacterium]|nr:histidine kinase dimerization/phospho-acceptor domain-containing protein [bacterium]